MKKNDFIFPVWKPRSQTIKKIHSDVFKVRYKTLRNASSAFVRKKEVREYINNKYHGCCYLCGSTENLQIDHKISVYRFAKDMLPYKGLNKEENLALICGTCNAMKKP